MTEIPPAPVGPEGYYVGNQAQASAFPSPSQKIE